MRTLQRSGSPKAQSGMVWSKYLRMSHACRYSWRSGSGGRERQRSSDEHAQLAELAQADARAGQMLQPQCALAARDRC
jgi:hypothetical protein